LKQFVNTTIQGLELPLAGTENIFIPPNMWLDSAMMEFKLELSKSTIDKCLHTNACKIIGIAPNFEHKFVFLFSACEMSMMS
jgi:hypothetical protein